MLLEVDNLNVSFRQHDVQFRALRGVSFQLDRHQSLGIVGESGSGKSLTALSIMGLIKQGGAHLDSGSIKFEGTDLLQLSEKQLRPYRGKRMGMIFQEPMTSLNPVFTIENQLIEMIHLHSPLRGQAAKEKLLDMMKLVGIPEPQLRSSFYPHQLSGGMRQRVMIAMALMANPDLLIADEPTTALDVTIQAQILNLIRDLQNEFKTSLILISHDFGIVSQMTEQLLVMYAGQVLEHGETMKILREPKHPYTKALQKASPSLMNRGKRLYSIPFMVPSIHDLSKNINLEERWLSLNEDIQRPLADLVTRPASPAQSPILELKELKVYYPIPTGFFGQNTNYVKAVDGVSLQIQPGEILGLVGESGCGKSTLGKAIVGLVPSFAGEIRIHDQAIINHRSEEKKKLRKAVQMIFQDPFSSLNPRMTVGQIIEEPLIIHFAHLGSKAREKRVDELLEKVGLRSEAKLKFPHEFSGGQRQRIGIARALAVEPQLLIADEPVSALDVSIQAQILNLLHDLRDEFNLTYLFISHDLHVVQYLCDRVAVMLDGQIVEELTPDDLRNPSIKKSEYTEKLLASIPEMKLA